MVRLVLFDIDGTLILTGGAGEKAFAKVCASAFNVSEGAKGLRFAGRTDTAIVRDFFNNHGLEPSPENFRRFFDDYVFWLDHMLGQLQGHVLPGIERWLHALKERPNPPVVGLLTGNIRLGAQIKLGHYHLWKHFEIGAFGDDHENRNQVALLARERGSRHLRQPLRSDEIVVVGDTPMDIECGRAIGAKVVAVATGSYSNAQLRDHHPTWLAEDLDRLDVEMVLNQARHA